MRDAGFTLIEILVALVLVGVLYTFLAGNLQARRDAAKFLSNAAQARAWSDVVEVERRRDTLPTGTTGADALGGLSPLSPYTPFGAPYRITANERFAVVSADVPSRVRGGGVFRESEEGGVFVFSPSVFLPTRAMWDKVFLYEEEVR